MQNLSLALLLVLFGASAASAQSTGLNCQDFRKNNDGSWSPIRPVSIQLPSGGNVVVGPGVTLRPGGQFMGFDLATVLNAQCK